MFTILEKARILCAITAEVETQVGDWFGTLWVGSIGYAPPDEQAIDVEDKSEWEERINQEWTESSDFLAQYSEKELRRTYL